MKGERTSKQQNYFYFITKPNYFITIFLHHVLLWEAKLKILARKRKALNIGGVASEAYIWFDKADKTKNQRGAQIDLIIERADRVINLCEMKFSQAQYKISADYEIKLRNRMELFRDRTHCTKSLVNTFVTTFGVANGIHSSIVNSEVTLDNLFQE